jgi:hypothetical protein
MVRALITASLALNIIVLVPVCSGLLSNASWTAETYGPESAARGILLAVYGAILLCSAGLLLKPLPLMVAALLIVQIVYKLMTPLTVGGFTNPVVISNIAIAAFHSVTLWTIWRGSHG